MDSLSAVFIESLSAAPRISVFGLFTLSTSVFICFGITIFLSVGAYFLTRNLQLTPSKKQMLLESAVGFLNKFFAEQLGSRWKLFAPWLGSVGLFILCSNLVGIFGLSPPTKYLSVTVALALLSVLLIYGAQLRYQGLAKFAKPVPVMLPFNLMEIAIRPLSLCMRLFGNILAGHLIMEVLHHLIPVVIPVFFSLYFDLFDGIIQMIVFVFLTTLFLGEGIDAHEESETLEKSPQN